MSCIENALSYSYFYIHNLIKVHLYTIKQDYLLNINNDNNSLMFNSPSIYLNILDVKGVIVESKQLATDDDCLTYSFLIFRLISQQPFNLNDNYIITLYQNKTEMYSNYDIYNVFKYKSNGQEILPFTYKSNKGSLNNKAKEILDYDVTETKQILKTFFLQSTDQLTLLKSSSLQEAENVCSDLFGTTDHNKFIEQHICLEIFNLAKNLPINVSTDEL